MRRPSLPPDFPEQIDDNEKQELERGMKLLSAMIEVVRNARHSAPDVAGKGGENHD